MPVSNDSRLLRAREWLSGLAFPATLPDSIRSASSDASFRRYFRVDTPQGNSLVVMDAPPEREPLHSFLHVAQLLDAAGVRVPGRLAVNEAEGYLLLEDFGNDTYLPLLKTESAGVLYRDAWLALIKIQSWSLLQTPQALNLPVYDREKLTQEMSLFEAWYVEKHLGTSLNQKEKETLAKTLGALCTKALAQPQVLVHRDYHSRNLMRLASGSPGLLDFQDAVVGPITYDLVSLLRDAYIVWEEDQQIDWAVRYWQDARKAGLPVAEDFSSFWEDFEWMGLQRHLKVLGIFARLYHRDGKDGYLKDLPVVMAYASSVAHRYDALSGLARILDRLAGVAPETQFTF